MVYDPITETFNQESFGEGATLQTMTEALLQRIQVINAKNESTSRLIDQINTKIQEINDLIPQLGTLNVNEFNAFKEQLRGYISSVENGADKEVELNTIITTLNTLLQQLQQKAGEVRGGGRRTKKHKKSKSKGKGKGKAAKSKGRKTRRGRSGKAKKSLSRKHTSKRR